jgi:hypothetical protein
MLRFVARVRNSATATVRRYIACFRIVDPRVFQLHGRCHRPRCSRAYVSACSSKAGMVISIIFKSIKIDLCLA